MFRAGLGAVPSAQETILEGSTGKAGIPALLSLTALYDNGHIGASGSYGESQHLKWLGQGPSVLSHTVTFLLAP